MTDPTPDVPTPVGRPQGGMKSEEGRSAYWRMQWESAIGALADLIAEHTETVDRLEAAEGAVARVEALDFESVIDEHFVMWHEMGGIDEPPGEWRCQCGIKFGFSPTAVQHVATALRAALAEVTP